MVVGLIAFAAIASSATAQAPSRVGLQKHRAVQEKHRVAQRPAYWGAWIGEQLTGTQAPWDMNAVSQFEGLVGKGLSLIEFAAPFANCRTTPCAYYNFPTTEMESIRAYGAIPVFSWSSAGSSEDLNDPPFRLANLIAGAQDAHIRRFAEAARDWGHPFFLRFNWEMNGFWFPWSEGVNSNQPGESVAAWRHVHDVFASVGATNVTWLWCPYADSNRKFKDVRRFYPGGRYVDWTCMDGYNWARNPVNPHRWKSFNKIFSSTYRQITKRIAPRKPMMLGELASTGPGKAKATWIRNMFKELATRYRRIRGLIWFNKIDRGIDWPLESSPPAAHAFGKGIRNPQFQANTQGSVTSPIGPPG